MPDPRRSCSKVLEDRGRGCRRPALEGGELCRLHQRLADLEHRIEPPRCRCDNGYTFDRNPGMAPATVCAPCPRCNPPRTAAGIDR